MGGPFRAETMIWALLKSPLGLKGLLAAGILFTGWYWHTGAIRRAKQEQAAETRSAVLKEASADYQADKQRYEARITDLEDRLTELASRRIQSAQRVEIITREAERERNEVDTKSDADVLAAIRSRLQPATQP